MHFLKANPFGFFSFEVRFLIALLYSPKLLTFKTFCLGERVLKHVKESAYGTVDKMFVALYGNLLTRFPCLG